MAFCKLDGFSCTKHLSNWWRQPIHPVFLYVRDDNIHSKFVREKRLNAHLRLKVVLLVLSALLIISLVVNRDTDEVTVINFV